MRAKLVLDNLNENNFSRVSRRDLVDIFYREYDDSNENMKRIINKMKKKILRYSEEEFLDFVKSNGINIEPLGNNRYYLK